MGGRKRRDEKCCDFCGGYELWKWVVMVLGLAFVELAAIVFVQYFENAKHVAHDISTIISLAAVALAFFSLWALFHFLASDVPNTMFKEFQRDDIHSIKSYIHGLDIQQMTRYRQINTFRRMMVMAGCILAAFFGIAMFRAPCNCENPPLALFVIATAVLYILRLLGNIVLGSYYDDRQKLMIEEIYNFQNSGDTVRLFDQAMVDLVIPQPVKLIEYAYGLFVIFNWVATLFATIWYKDGACKGECPRLFYSTKYLIIASWALELMALVMGASVLFLERTSGVGFCNRVAQAADEKHKEQHRRMHQSLLEDPDSD